MPTEPPSSSLRWSLTTERRAALIALLIGTVVALPTDTSGLMLPKVLWWTGALLAVRASWIERGIGIGAQTAQCCACVGIGTVLSMHISAARPCSARSCS